MLFSSSVFLFLFLPVVLLCITCPAEVAAGRTCFLLLASLASMPGGAWFVLVMLGSILANSASACGWMPAASGRTCAPPLVTALR